MHRGGRGSGKGESDGLIHQRPLLGRNLSHNRDKNFFSNSPQISSKHRHSPPWTAVYECAAVSWPRIPRVSIAAHSRVSFQLIGGIWSGPLQPNGSLEFETMIWVSRAARSDASSKGLYGSIPRLRFSFHSYWLTFFLLPFSLIPFHRRSAPSPFVFLSSASVSLSPRYRDMYITTRDVAR